LNSFEYPWYVRLLINHACWAIVALSGWSVKLGEDQGDPKYCLIGLFLL
jgi:hypothetical protein